MKCDATDADARQARGELLWPLHGAPLTARCLRSGLGSSTEFRIGPWMCENAFSQPTGRNLNRDLALFNLAIDSKVRGCDVVAVRVDDVAPSGYAMDRATIRQKKTGPPVRFELTDQTRQAVDEYLRLTSRKAGQFLFAGRGNTDQGWTTRQYARLVQEWVASIGFDPNKFGTHSLRRTKAVLIYRRTGNLRALQLLLGHSKIESTVGYLGIEVDDAIEIAEKIGI